MLKDVGNKQEQDPYEHDFTDQYEKKKQKNILLGINKSSVPEWSQFYSNKGKLGSCCSKTIVNRCVTNTKC